MKPGTINLAGKRMAIITDLHQGGVRLSKHDRPGAPVFITESFAQPVFLEPDMSIADTLTKIAPAIEAFVESSADYAVDKASESKPWISTATKTSMKTGLNALIEGAVLFIADYSAQKAATPAAPVVTAPSVTVTPTA